MPNSAANSTRRELAELKVQYELFPDTRDLLVESTRDAWFYRWLLSAIEIPGVRVYPIDRRVDVPRATVEDLGYDWGVRGRLIALSVTADRWSLPGPSVTCIVDSDFEVVNPSLPHVAALLRTTYPSLESYGLLPGPFAKIALASGLEIDKIPGHLGEAMSALNLLFIARYLLHSARAPVGMVENVHRYLRNVAGHLNVDTAAIIAKSVQSAPTLVQAESVVSSMSAFPRPRPPSLSHVRGHDIPPVLRVLLGLSGKRADPDTIEESLLMAIDADDMVGDLLAVDLRARLGA